MTGRPELIAHRRFSSLVLCALLVLPTVARAQEPALSPSIGDTVPVPNAERALTHDELLDVRGEWKQGDWGVATLVADTVIERGLPLRGPPEEGVAGVALGTLPRSGQHPGDPVVKASRPVAAQFPDEDTPIRGLLAIDLQRESLELHGRVEEPTGTYITPIEPDAIIMADDLPTGALIVARGWLSILAPAGPCPDVPKALDPHDAQGRSSPFVRCPGGWLTADEVTEVDPDDPTAPAGYGIPVQHGALERFTRSLRDEAVVHPATYLLRRVANPIDGAEPMFGWEVVGRLDPTDDHARPDPPDPADVARPAGLAWQPGLERQPPADGWWLHSTAWIGGFASVHQGRDRVLSAWVSPDGRTWQGSVLPRGIRWVRALLPLDDGLVIVADEEPFDRTWRFEVWTSTDGLEWAHAARQRVRTPKRFDGHRRIVHGYWSLGGEIVALETYTTQACCGRGPGWMMVADSERQSDVTFAWASRDGLDWDRQVARGIPSRTREYLGHLLMQGDGELLALWGDPRHTIGHSVDGVRWGTVGHHPAEIDLYTTSLITRTNDGFVLGGSVEGQADQRSQDRFTLWHSVDGDAWERTLERPGGRPRSIASTGDTVIVSGNDLDARYLDQDPPPELPWLIVSRDAGRSLDASLAWNGDSDWCLRSLTVSGTTVSLDAACAPRDAASTYAVTLGPAEEAASVPTPVEALECDFKGRPHSVRDEWDYLGGYESPDEALRTVVREGFVIPVRDYHVLAKDGSTVLYGYRNRGEVKVAIRVTSPAGDGERWIPEWLADCRLSEYGRNPDMGPGVWLWANRRDRTVQERRGPAHCDWQSVRFLYWSRPDAPQTVRATSLPPRSRGPIPRRLGGAVPQGHDAAPRCSIHGISAGRCGPLVGRGRTRDVRQGRSPGRAMAPGPERYRLRVTSVGTWLPFDGLKGKWDR